VTTGFTVTGSNLNLTWAAGTLLGADNITGPWTPVDGVTSPYAAPTTGARKFYQVQVSP